MRRGARPGNNGHNAVRLRLHHAPCVFHFDRRDAQRMTAVLATVFTRHMARLLAADRKAFLRFSNAGRMRRLRER
jgi:hypothetical protein